MLYFQPLSVYAHHSCLYMLSVYVDESYASRGQRNVNRTISKLGCCTCSHSYTLCLRSELCSQRQTELYFKPHVTASCTFSHSFSVLCASFDFFALLALWPLYVYRSSSALFYTVVWYKWSSVIGLALTAVKITCYLLLTTYYILYTYKVYRWSSVIGLALTAVKITCYLLLTLYLYVYRWSSVIGLALTAVKTTKSGLEV